jgi:hypothetical protein
LAFGSNRHWRRFADRDGLSCALRSQKKLHEVEAAWYRRYSGYFRLGVGSIGAVVYAGWLMQRGHATQHAADVALGFGGGALLSSALWIVYARFPQLMRAEQHLVEAEGSGMDSAAAAADLDRFAPVVWTQFVAFALAAFIGLCALLVAGAGAEHLDPASAGSADDAVWVVGALSIAAVLAGLGYARERSAAPWGPNAQRTEFAELRGTQAATALITAGLLVASLVPLILLHPSGRLQPESMIVSLALGIFIAENVFANSAWVQLAAPNWSSMIAILLSVTAFAAPLYWLLQTGLWSGSTPARTAVAAPLALSVLALTAGTLAFTISGLGWRTPRLSRSFHRPGQNGVQDCVVAAGVTLLAAVVPVYVASRSHHVSTGIVVLHLAVLAGLVVALGTAAFNDLDYLTSEHKRSAAWALTYAESSSGGGSQAPARLPPALDEERVKRIQVRIWWWQIPVPAVILLSAVIWLLIHLQ